MRGSVDRCAAGLLDEVVGRFEDKAAVVEHGGQITTYGELWELAGGIARRLQHVGVRSGDAVVIRLRRSREFVAAMVATARLGAHYVLVDESQPAERNLAIAELVRAKAWIDSTPRSQGADWLPDRVAHVQASDWVVEDPLVGFFENTPDDPLYITFTSGSTGTPKGVIASHGAVLNFLFDSRLCDISSTSVVASQCGPMSDATTFEIWKPLVHGATILVMPSITEVPFEEWFAIFRRSGITDMFLMTTLFAMIAKRNPCAFDKLDTLVFGGEAADVSVVRSVLGGQPPRRLVQGYGPTEVTVFASRTVCSVENTTASKIPLGDLLDNYEWFIADASLDEVARGQVGELVIGGPSVASGYAGLPDETAARFVRVRDRVGRMYRTGDLVRATGANEIEFVGRRDRQVKLRSFRIELEEIESALLATGLVSHVIVDKGEEPSPHLFCLYWPRASLAAAEVPEVELAAALARRLPGYMIPARWLGQKRLPLTATGKLDRTQAIAGQSASDRYGQ